MENNVNYRGVGGETNSGDNEHLGGRAGNVRRSQRDYLGDGEIPAKTPCFSTPFHTCSTFSYLFLWFPTFSCVLLRFLTFSYLFLLLPTFSPTFSTFSTLPTFSNLFRLSKFVNIANLNSSHSISRGITSVKMRYVSRITRLFYSQSPQSLLNGSV